MAPRTPTTISRHGCGFVRSTAAGRLLHMRTPPAAEHRLAPIRQTSGRQTLGSNHDAPQGGPYPREGTPHELEPADNTRPVWWHIFKDQCGALHGERRRMADRLVRHLETGWTHITKLQLECERQRAGRGVPQDARVAHLIGYLESEVVGVFTECVEQCARIFSGATEAEGGIEALTGVAARFERGLAISIFASESTQVPRALKAISERVSNALVDWSAEFGALVAAVLGNPK